MKYYINIFIIFSIIGYIFENIIKYTIFPNIDTNTMYGPWIPIYGLGTCIIIVLLRFIFKRIKTNKYTKNILLFICSGIILSLLELIGGIIMEKLTGRVMWDYSFMKFHIGKYISLEMAFLWGIMALIVTHLIKPLLDKIIKKIPSILTYLVFVIFILDIIISMVVKF